VINFSEILWKSGRKKNAGFRSDLVATSEDIQTASSLDHTPVENVQIKPGSRIALLTDSRSASADRFRFIRMRLRELRELAKLRSLIITSPLAEDGKSTVAISLATALAEGGRQSVLLIEADLHRPSLASSLGLRPKHGLAECLEDGLDPLAQIRKVAPLGWYLLSAGEPRSNPTELLQSDALPTVLQSLSPHFDWILIDTPPVLPLTDALQISREVDAILLVTRAGRTPREAVEETVKLIGRKHLVGIILNGAEGLTRLYSRYNERYRKT
jgi:capsular exopolysaccharide synthesis family protein